MSATYDADLDEFERRITELQESPADRDKRRAVSDQSIFVLDSVLRAVFDHAGFINEARRSRALSLFDMATRILSTKEDGFYGLVLRRAKLTQMRLKATLAA